MRIDGASITVLEMTPFPMPLPRRRMEDGVRLYTRKGEKMDMDADMEPLRPALVSTSSVTLRLADEEDEEEEEEGWPIAPPPPPPPPVYASDDDTRWIFFGLP